MISEIQRTRELLHGHDPVPEGYGTREIDQPGREDILARILETSAPQQPSAGRAPTPPARWTASSSSRRPSRRILLLAAAVATVTVGVGALGQFGLPGNPTATAQAATPRMLAYQPLAGTAGHQLREIATTLRKSKPAPVVSTGKYRYISSREWSLVTMVDGKNVTSAVLPEKVEQWTADDGSGRVSRTPTAAEFPSAASRKAWQDQGRPSLPRSDETLPAGGMPSLFPADLSSNPAALSKQLQESHPASNGPAEVFTAVSDLYRERVLAPPVRAAVLDVVAGLPGLTLTGRTTDRLGRNGIAVSLTSDMTGLPTRFTLVFDPQTGNLLSDEEVLTTSAGKLRVAIPSVISYTAYESAGYTSTTSQRP